MAKLRLVDAPAPDLSDAEDELYSVSPEEFIGRRKELVTAARAAKDRALATSIGQLRRPTRSAWLLNLLARAEPDQIAELLAVGEALADAQRRRSGDDLRRLSKDRRTAVDAATRRAVALGVEHDHTAADATVTEVAQTLTAALADADVAEDLRRGRLASSVSYGGFGPDAVGAAGGDSLAAALAAMSGAAAPEAAVPEPEREVDPEVVKRAAALATAREAADSARDAAEDAEAAAETATNESDELVDRVEQLKTELAEVTAAAEAAQKTARDRRRKAQDLRKAANAAESEVTLMSETVDT